MIYKTREHFLSGQVSCVPSVGVCVGEARGVAAKPQLVKKQRAEDPRQVGSGGRARPQKMAACSQHVCRSAPLCRTAEPLRKRREAEVILPAGGFFQRRLFM